MRRGVVTLAAAAVAVLLPACTTSGLSFVQDDRVRVVSPSSNERVRVPFDVTWTASGYDGYYGVFVDTTPMRPERGLQSLVPAEDPCRERPSCPDAAWLLERTSYVTKETSVRIDRLPDRRGSDRSSDRHQLTIVLLNPDGTRAGESAFVREFIVERDG